MLWKKGRLRRHTPKVLLNTTWYLVTQHFGLRGRQENYDLRVEHFKFAKDENGRKYVTFADYNPTKTRKSSIKLQWRMVIPRMVATGGERCPVSIFEDSSKTLTGHHKWFISRRPSEFKESSSLYLAINYSNIKSLDSYLDTMNERKSTEISLAGSGISSKALQVQNPSSSINSATQLSVQGDSSVQQRSMSTTTSQMCASTQSFITSTTIADTQLHQLPPIHHLSSVGNNISGQATINITFNIQPPQWSKVLGLKNFAKTYTNVFWSSLPISLTV